MDGGLTADPASVADPTASPVGGRVVATLLGRDGDEVLPAETLAAWAQTIEYELVTRIGAHLTRVVVGDPRSLG